MTVEKQISVFLVNKPGRLASVCSALAKQKINLLALTVMDAKEHSVLRLVCDDVAGTRRVLRELGASFAETDVLLVEMNHRPGELARICQTLAEEHINIDYAYCSAGTPNGKALGVFRVSSIARAMRLLSAGRGATRKKAAPVRRRPGPKR